MQRKTMQDEALRSTATHRKATLPPRHLTQLSKLPTRRIASPHSPAVVAPTPDPALLYSALLYSALLCSALRHSPLNITGLIPNPSSTRPTYPVSSFNSRSAHCSAVSPASMRPAGTSMQTALTGGRNCFWRRIEGPLAVEGLDEDPFCRIATMPTPSIRLPAGRVRRVADSHVRRAECGSV